MNRHTLYGCRIAIRQITQSKTQTQTELLRRHAMLGLIHANRKSGSKKDQKPQDLSQRLVYAVYSALWAIRGIASVPCKRALKACAH